MAAVSIIPDIPGDLVPPNSDQERWLKHKVSMLCNLENQRYVYSDELTATLTEDKSLRCVGFLAANPSASRAVLWSVSRTKSTLPPSSLTRVVLTRNYSFWVCEKSDGIRVLFFVCTNGPTDQTVYLVRWNNYPKDMMLY
jgi:mRNA guanylyltransferase